MRELRGKNGVERFRRDRARYFCFARGMTKSLPAVGSLALLNVLTDFVPDDFINARWPIPCRSGRRFRFSAALGALSAAQMRRVTGSPSYVVTA